MSRVGIFELVDPPAGMVETITVTVGAIAFPWERVQPYLDREGIDAIRICWGAPSWMSNETTGNWNAADNTIYLGTQFANWQDDVPFVLTHEIGHMIDTTVLTDRQRKQLVQLFHGEPAAHDEDPQFGHDSQMMTHVEQWSNGSAPYSARIYENWADQFVAAFAPTVWDGTLQPGYQHWPRFVHWSDDLEAMRRIVLTETKPAPKPKPAPSPDPVPAPPPVARTNPRRRRRWWPCRWWGWFGK